MNDLGHNVGGGPGGDADGALRQVYGELRRLPLFGGLPNEDLWRAIGSGGVRRLAIERDHFIADPDSVADGSAAKIYLVAEGQIAVAVFDTGTLAERKAQQQRYERMSREERQELSALRPEPLTRLARKNLATFMDGDLFNAAALTTGARGDVAFYTVAPTIVASISHSTIAELAVRHPFFEARLRRAIEHSRDRLRNIAGVKQEILDFFIRQGISVSGEMVRVRQLDSCIDCKLCEEACQERYGAKRLTLGGYQLGMLDFVFTCRTCSDQRCIDPCEYDSIKFDPNIREVVINESSCTGCTLCARSCPYQAIEMVAVDDPHEPGFQPDFKLRLDASGALAYGPGRPRVARPRRIANKCDHCMGYGEQACVSACPTGSLIEVNAYELFRERGAATVASARTGFERDVKLDRAEILPTEPFTQGIGVRDAGMAKVRRGRIAPVAIWGLALAAWFLALAEILLRIYRPESSLQYVMLRGEGLEPAIALLKVGYRAGSDLAVNCGYIGTGLMVVALFYTPMRRMRWFRRLASNTMWFDFHMMAGTMGPMFIVLHSALKLDNWVSAAFWSMIIVVLSGVIGRYLYTQVPDLLNGRELEELDHHRALARLRTLHPQSTFVADDILNRQRTRAQRVAERGGLLGALLWILFEDVRRPFRWLRRGGAFRAGNTPRKVAKELAFRTGRLLLVERRRVLMPRAQLLLHAWKKVHVPFSVIMTAIAVVHIVLAFKYSL